MSNSLSAFSEFSPKQLDVLTWWCHSSDKHGYDAIICDGAVRSGKTVCMSLSFVAWTFYDFNETDDGTEEEKQEQASGSGEET